MNRKQTYEYKRILEILKDYWLTEPDELIVRVRMDFMHANGDTQNKQIVWWNPEYKIPTEYYGEPITADECIKQARDREEWLKEHPEQRDWFKTIDPTKCIHINKEESNGNREDN